jgi:hypothetical protein
LAGFTTTSVFTAAVPEPETWTMLLVGFILLSVNLRRKNQGDPRRPSFALASHLRS